MNARPVLCACAIAVLATAADVRCDPGLSCGPRDPSEEGHAVCEGIDCEIEDLAAGRSHTCGRRRDHTVVCWGANESYQLGAESLMWSEASLVPERAVVGLDDALLVAAGESQSCATRENGSVICWGGLRTRVDIHTIGELRDAVDLAAGARHACAVLTNGEIACWGSNDDGQIGTDDAGWYGIVSVRGVPMARGVAAGSSHSCAWTERDEVWCWGAYQWELLPLRPVTLPRFIGFIRGITMLTAGYGHTCALDDAGRVLCWGRGLDGELGRRFAESSDEPDLVVGIEDAIQITAGGGHVGSSAPTPDQVPFEHGHTCALRAEGQVLCWGDNEQGQLGNGTTDPAITPSPVRGLEDAVLVRAGGLHTCALRESGEVVCWGSNDHGQLGTGAPTGYRVEPAALNSFNP